MRLSALLILLAAISGYSLAQSPAVGKPPFTFEDMMALKRIGSPQISPDSKWVLFSAVDVDLQANKKTSHLWLVPLAGGEARQLTSDPAGEDRGRWSPDGRQLIFVSGRGGSSQIWLADFDSASGALAGAPRQITTISTEADGAIWLPGGKNILFTSEVYWDCADDACNKNRDEEHAASKVKAMIFTRLFYRHWSSYTHFKRTHLFVQPVTGGTAKDITPGDHDVPPFSLGGQDMYAISPDGQEVAFTSNIDEVEAISTNSEIFVVPISGGTPKKISTSPGADTTPLYSPDGKYIAWRSQARAGFEADKWRLFLQDRQSGQTRDLTGKFDRSIGSFTWARDSSSIYFTAENAGESPIFSTSVGANWTTIAENDGLHADDLTINNGILYFTRMSIQSSNEIWRLYLSTIHDANPTAVTHMNDAYLSQIDMQPLESFT